LHFRAQNPLFWGRQWYWTIRTYLESAVFVVWAPIGLAILGFASTSTKKMWLLLLGLLAVLVACFGEGVWTQGPEFIGYVPALALLIGGCSLVLLQVMAFWPALTTAFIFLIGLLFVESLSGYHSDIMQAAMAVYYFVAFCLVIAVSNQHNFLYKPLPKWLMAFIGLAVTINTLYHGRIYSSIPYLRERVAYYDVSIYKKLYHTIAPQNERPIKGVYFSDEPTMPHPATVYAGQGLAKYHDNIGIVPMDIMRDRWAISNGSSRATQLKANLFYRYVCDHWGNPMELEDEEIPDLMKAFNEFYNVDFLVTTPQADGPNIKALFPKGKRVIRISKPGYKEIFYVFK
jgi:hypothetical protein